MNFRSFAARAGLIACGRLGDGLTSDFRPGKCNVMPYRHAYWYLVALFPLVGLAFWPTYFAIFSTSPAALHAHAAAGTLWIAILAVQSWMIHHGRREFHRQTGIASLGVFPIFVAASAAVVVLMARQFAGKLSPVAVAYGPRLGLGSIGLTIGFVYCYWQGLRQRRKVHPHSRYMLATVVFLLPPIFVRLLRFVPLLDIRGAQDLWKLALNIQLANILVAVFVFILAWRAGKHGRPFVEAGTVILVDDILLQAVGVKASWQGFFALLASIPLPAAALAAGAAGIIVAYCGWLAGKRATPRAETAPA